MGSSPTGRNATLVLLRHGHSAGNAGNVVTGWQDVPLTDRGRAEAARSAGLLVEHGCVPDVVHASVLSRAVDTARIVADALVARGRRRPVTWTHWELNERHYGALQGHTRPELIARYGAERFARWRRGYHDAPPRVGPDDPAHPAGDPRYAAVDPADLPGGESLAAVRVRVARVGPVLAADLRAGRTVLVVAHGNSLRALCMLLDRLGPAEVERLDLPTGVPLRYDLDAGLSPRRRGGVYLDPDAARAGIAEVVAQGGPPVGGGPAVAGEGAAAGGSPRGQEGAVGRESAG